MKIGDITKLSSSDNFREQVIEHFNINFKPKLQKKLFSSFYYTIIDGIFYVTKDDKLNMFITYEDKDKFMVVKVVENISSEKQLMFKVFNVTIGLGIFKEILTGDTLSVHNINAHKRAINNGSNLYIRDLSTGKDTLIDAEDIDFIMDRKSKKEVFVLKESQVLESLKEMYNTTLEEYITEVLERV